MTRRTILILTTIIALAVGASPNVIVADTQFSSVTNTLTFGVLSPKYVVFYYVDSTPLIRDKSDPTALKIRSQVFHVTYSINETQQFLEDIKPEQHPTMYELVPYRLEHHKRDFSWDILEAR